MMWLLSLIRNYRYMFKFVNSSMIVKVKDSVWAQNIITFNLRSTPVVSSVALVLRSKKSYVGFNTSIVSLFLLYCTPTGS